MGVSLATYFCCFTWGEIGILHFTFDFAILYEGFNNSFEYLVEGIFNLGIWKPDFLVVSVSKLVIEKELSSYTLSDAIVIYFDSAGWLWL